MTKVMAFAFLGATVGLVAAFAMSVGSASPFIG